MSEQAIEQEIQAKGLTAPRITPARIDELMSRVTYSSYVSPIGTSTFVHAFLDEKFYLASGHSACVSPENFNAEIGVRIASESAEEKARDKLWELEGYMLKFAPNPVAPAPGDIARVCHEVNRAYCEALGDSSQPKYEDAPQWQRDSAMMGVTLHLNNPDSGPQASHESWMAQKVAEGWVYGPEKNPELKQHHCMVPFDQLPREQQAKDFLFRGVVHALKTS